jgi:hypothetical protein
MLKRGGGIVPPTSFSICLLSSEISRRVLMLIGIYLPINAHRNRSFNHALNGPCRLSVLLARSRLSVSGCDRPRPNWQERPGKVLGRSPALFGE